MSARAEPVRVGGVDGARGQWVLAVLDDKSCTATQLEGFGEVVAVAQRLELDAVAVDMPMGLPSSGARPSDALVRDVLGRRRSTLFPTPPAPVLTASHFDQANRLHREHTGKGMSKQAFNLVPAIAQVRRAVLDAPPDLRRRFHEAHPETTFAVLTGAPLPPKKTAAGVGRRLQVLAGLIDDPAAVLASAPPSCAPDDILDAVAVAWSARRHAVGLARVFGEGVDDDGFPLSVIA